MKDSDHDLLIELKTQMVAVREDIQKLSDTTFTRLTNLEQNSVSKFQFDDHETRMRSLERQRWMIVGGSAVVAAIIGYASNIIGKLH